MISDKVMSASSITVAIHRYLAAVYLKEKSIPTEVGSHVLLSQSVKLGSCVFAAVLISSSGGSLASTLETRESPMFSLLDSSEL